MSRITQSTLPKPDMSWRRNRSLATVMSSQNHRMNMNMAKASATKLANVKPPSNSMIFSLDSVAPPPSRHAAVDATRRPERGTAGRQEVMNARKGRGEALAGRQVPVARHTAKRDGCLLRRRLRATWSRRRHGHQDNADWLQ